MVKHCFRWAAGDMLLQQVSWVATFGNKENAVLTIQYIFHKFSPCDIVLRLSFNPLEHITSKSKMFCTVFKKEKIDWRFSKTLQCRSYVILHRQCIDLCEFSFSLFFVCAIRLSFLRPKILFFSSIYSNLKTFWWPWIGIDNLESSTFIWLFSGSPEVSLVDYYGSANIVPLTRV